MPIPTFSSHSCWWPWRSSRAAPIGLDARGVATLATIRACCRARDRPLYTAALQDRIIMLEMKVRCAEILPAGDDAELASLGLKQIVALRFASDEELGALLDRAVRDNLSPNEIKAAIKTWRPDLDRT